MLSSQILFARARPHTFYIIGSACLRTHPNSTHLRTHYSGDNYVISLIIHACAQAHTLMHEQLVVHAQIGLFVKQRARIPCRVMAPAITLLRNFMAGLPLQGAGRHKSCCLSLRGSRRGKAPSSPSDSPSYIIESCLQLV